MYYLCLILLFLSPMQICPVLLWFSVKKLVLEPLEAKRREEKRRRKREANKEKVAIARREAEASISLMEERFARIVGEEEAKGGLVICSALYGRLEDSGGGLHRVRICLRIKPLHLFLPRVWLVGSLLLLHPLSLNTFLF